MLQCAQGSFQKWPEGFLGFTARIRCRDARCEVTGDVRVLPGGGAEVSLAGAVMRTWAEAALRAISQACTPSFFKDGDGRFPITFDTEDGHPLGRRVRVDLGGGCWRAYRIDAKGRIREQEHAGPSRRVTATYDDLVRTSPGRVVPARTRILECCAATHTPLENAEIEDTYRRIDYVLLPTRRQATVARSGAIEVFSMELDEHRLI
jgi:hypothetical protein